MGRFFIFQVLGCFAAIVAGYFLLGRGSSLAGFAYGVAVFCLNLGLLIVVVKLVFALIGKSGARDGGSRWQRIRQLLVMALLVASKISFVGVTVYLGLVRWNLPTFSFVAGGALGLASAAVLGTVCQSQIIRESPSVT